MVKFCLIVLGKFGNAVKFQQQDKLNVEALVL